jgi:hypothetical protein
LRKAAAVAAAVILAVLALTAPAGCNNSEEAARRYIENARRKYNAVAQANEKLNKKYTALLALGQSQQAVTPAAMKQGLADMIAIINSMDRSSEAVRSEYQKVLDLDGAGRYKELARVEIQKLGLVKRKARLANDLAASAVKVLDAYAAGQTIDQAAIQGETQQIIEQRNKISEQYNKLEEESADLEEDLNL